MAMIGEVHEMFVQHVRAAKLPEPVCGYMLSLLDGHPGGDVWFDFAWPDQKVAVQIGHKEQRLYQQAVRVIAEEQGWCVCYFSGEMVRYTVAISAVIVALNGQTGESSHGPSEGP